MHAKVLEAFDKAERTMLSGISAKELESIGKIMEKMTENLKNGLGGEFVD